MTVKVCSVGMKEFNRVGGNRLSLLKLEYREQGPAMFGGGGNFTMPNCLVSILLLFAFLIQTRARYERIFY